MPFRIPIVDQAIASMHLTLEDLLDIPMISELILDGEEIAEKRGKEAGKKEHAVATLTNLLTYRFGKLPAWAKKKIKVADVKTLDGWALRMLSAETLEEALK